jgi:uncharacterized protein (TIGR02145 family)
MVVDGALGVPVITTQPKAFSFSRLRDTEGDPNGPAAANVVITLSVVATNATSYQWYQKTSVVGAAPIKLTDGETPKIEGTATPSFTFRPKDVNVADWGLYQFYCVVSNASGSVTSDIAEVALGCGAKTTTGGWMKFMCHNLGAAKVGASQSLNAITFEYTSTGTGKDTVSIDAKGWWFQWGRLADGHQWRDNSAAHTIAGPDTILKADGSVSANRTGKFITNNSIYAWYTAFDWRYPQYDFLWRNALAGHVPCPLGWHVPSSSEWGRIYRDGGGSYGFSAQATVNKWTWKSGTTATGQGFLVQPDGATTTLFLPAAGYRDANGLVIDTGAGGYYWSTTSASSGAFFLAFSPEVVQTDVAMARGFGFSVRCIAEN